MSVKILFCYAHEDEQLLNKLKAHLRPLQRQGLIDVWHDRDISAGTEWEQEISKHLNEAQIILLLISPDFMNSDYCYGTEMKRAIERHDRGEAWVIPVILRPVYWQGVLGKLLALPKDALPITDPDWHNLDRALFSVTEGIRKVVEEISKHHLSSASEQIKDRSTIQPYQQDANEQDHLSDLETIKKQFHKAMIDLYHETYKVLHYRAAQFYRLVNEQGGVVAAHHLLAKEATDGFTKLWEGGRLDLSVEALVLKPEFAPLFDEAERQKARQRLAEYRYKASWDGQVKAN